MKHGEHRPGLSHSQRLDECCQVRLESGNRSERRCRVVFMDWLAVMNSRIFWMSLSLRTIFESKKVGCPFWDCLILSWPFSSADFAVVLQLQSKLDSDGLGFYEYVVHKPLQTYMTSITLSYSYSAVYLRGTLWYYCLLCPGSTGSPCGSQMWSSTFRLTSTPPEWRSTTTNASRTSPSTSPWRTRSTGTGSSSTTG